jgi:hypothetical protein
LGEVKDSIGDWHDWVELLKIARKVLDAREDRGVLKDIETIGTEKLQRAMTMAGQLRERYFARPDGRKPGRKLLQMAS